MIKTKIIGNKPLNGWWVLYERDEIGQLHRLHKKVRADQSQYPFSEKLMGWPESNVRWSSEIGHSFGIAC